MAISVVTGNPLSKMPISALPIQLALVVPLVLLVILSEEMQFNTHLLLVVLKPKLWMKKLKKSTLISTFCRMVIHTLHTIEKHVLKSDSL